jgi:hypothetical protein
MVGGVGTSPDGFLEVGGGNGGFLPIGGAGFGLEDRSSEEKDAVDDGRRLFLN